jgi:hypothetical protein
LSTSRNRPFLDQRVGERGVQHDHARGARGRREALARLERHRDLVGPELERLAVDRERHAAVGLELAQQRRAVGRGERGLERGHALADARPSARKVRLHLIGDVARRVAREVQLVHVELVAHEPSCASTRGRDRDREHDLGRGERLAHAQLVRRAHLEPSDTISRTARISRESGSSIAAASGSG